MRMKQNNNMQRVQCSLTALKGYQPLVVSSLCSKPGTEVHHYDSGEQRPLRASDKDMGQDNQMPLNPGARLLHPQHVPAHTWCWTGSGLHPEPFNVPWASVILLQPPRALLRLTPATVSGAPPWVSWGCAALLPERTEWPGATFRKSLQDPAGPEISHCFLPSSVLLPPPLPAFPESIP